MSDSLSMKITKMLFAERPELLTCDAKAVGEASASLADVLGSVLAIVRQTKGEATYQACVRNLAKRIDDSARKTTTMALAEPPNAAH